MKSGFLKLTPVFIAGGVLALVCLLQGLPQIFPKFDLLQRLEWITYDWRVKQALVHPAPVATNAIGSILLTEANLKWLGTNQSSPGPRVWPLMRDLHGQVIRELSAQGANVIVWDVFFTDPHPAYADLKMEGLTQDEFLARAMKEAGNVVNCTAPGDLNDPLEFPLAQFVQASADLGHINKATDSDGIMRRVPAFVDDKQGHRVWSLGIAAAAQALKLNLSNAVVEPGRRIILKGPNGRPLIIPIGASNCFYVDWYLPPSEREYEFFPQWTNNFVYTTEYRDILSNAWQRLQPGGTPPTNEWRNKIVVIGSYAKGANLTDRGATPLSKDTVMITTHWNVINSMLTGRFVRPYRYAEEFLLVVAMSLLAAVLSWKLRAGWASAAVLVVAAGYVWLCVHLYVQERIWLPIVLPLAGALLMTHVVMVSYRMFLERAQHQRVKSAFGKMVSPNIINLLLQEEAFTYGGARRDLTVLFADVRGFTQFTDTAQARAEERAQRDSLPPDAAKKLMDEAARETMATVNLYLTTIVDAVKEHDGTLDKYIGDCVMAFWGAPIPNAHHAAGAVRAAIAAHRALHALNEQRVAENHRIELENTARDQSGQPPLPTLPILTVGTGVNTGPMTVGFMGSEAHLSNYTVFGREVTIASRLEGVSGSGRVLIAELTYSALQRHDPSLAALCKELPAVTVKGIANPVKIYEVQWRAQPAPAAPA